MLYLLSQPSILWLSRYVQGVFRERVCVLVLVEVVEVQGGIQRGE